MIFSWFFLVATMMVLMVDEGLFRRRLWELPGFDDF
jgi:hypothetical protein